MTESKTAKRDNRFSIGVSDEAMTILDRYSSLMGISKGKLIDSWIIESKDTHMALLDQIEGVLKANK